MMTRVILTMVINADPEEAWDLVDEWVGRTAPEEVDSINIEIVIDLAKTPEFAIEEARRRSP